MTTKVTSLVIIIFILFSSALMAKKNVIIVATGGLLSGVESSKITNYKPTEVGVDQLLKSVPSLKNIANIKGEQVVQISSQNMTNNIWLKLAKRVQQLAQDSKVDAIVITHGTDTLEETAYFLNLVLHTNKPVVVVGAVRPNNVVGADGPENLYKATLVAINKQSAKQGVLVVMNDTIFSARDVVETNSLLLNSFAAPNVGPLGYIANSKVQYLSKSTKTHTAESEFNINNIKELPDVDIFYGYVEANANYINYAKTLGVKGIVYVGVGNGNLSVGVLNSLQNVSAKGMVVVRSSRISAGIVMRNNEINDDANHFVAAGSLNPQKSRILLMLGLTKSSNPQYIQSLFDKY